MENQNKNRRLIALEEMKWLRNTLNQALSQLLADPM